LIFAYDPDNYWLKNHNINYYADKYNYSTAKAEVINEILANYQKL